MVALSSFVTGSSANPLLSSLCPLTAVGEASQGEVRAIVAFERVRDTRCLGSEQTGGQQRGNHYHDHARTKRRRREGIAKQHPQS